MMISFSWPTKAARSMINHWKMKLIAVIIASVFANAANGELINYGFEENIDEISPKYSELDNWTNAGDEQNYEEGVNDNGHYFCEDCNAYHLKECPMAARFYNNYWIPDTPLTEGEGLRGVLSIPKGLFITKSKIKYAGRGVHAYYTFEKETIFGPYGGKVIPYTEPVPSVYCWVIFERDEMKYLVDAKDVRYSNWMRYVNCPKSRDESNIDGIQYRDQIFYVLTKTIYPGDELLVWYGEGYSDVLNKMTAERSEFRCSVCGKLFGGWDYMYQHEIQHQDTMTMCTMSEKNFVMPNTTQTLYFEYLSEDYSHFDF